MPPKRPLEDEEAPSGSKTKKQKTYAARQIDFQSAGPSTVPNSLKGLPSIIDVEKFTESRAFEIKAMNNAMFNVRAPSGLRAWQTLPRHLRRRAASHNIRRVPVRLRGKAQAEMDTEKRPKKKKQLPRQGKLKRLSRTEKFLRRQQDKSWLETHIWHAKRMKMENMWGYRLAVHPTEKAFRPSHRASVHGSILHDASYYSLIELKGKMKTLTSILRQCCDPQAVSPGSVRFISGSRVCEIDMYAPLAYPCDLIGPVSITWQPIQPEESTDTPSVPAPSDNEKRKRVSKECKKSDLPVDSDETLRTLWIRGHPVTFLPVHAALAQAASSTLEAIRASGGGEEQVDIADLRGEVNVFEIMGPKSSQVIKGALTLARGDNRKDAQKVWSLLKNLQTPGSVPRGMVLGFTVYDPRLNFPPKNAKVLPEGNQPTVSPPFTINPNATLARSTIWCKEERLKLSKPRFKKKDLDERRSKNLIPGTALRPLRQDNRVPIILIQRSIGSTTSPLDNTSPLHGWTLIVPRGWGMPFFSSLIYTGTRVAGQRERSTQYFEAGYPDFPGSYPGTQAYTDQAATIALEEQVRWDKKPPAKRPNYDVLGTRSPFKADWDVVLGLGLDGLLPTQRDPRDQERPDKIWLMRGQETLSILQDASQSESVSETFFNKINAARTRRGMEVLKVSPSNLLQGALVLVKVLLCGRGSPADLAIIYSIGEEEDSKWRQVLQKEGRGRKRSLMEMDEGLEQIDLAKIVPQQSDIVGYVMKGNFSLQRGRGHGVGALPASFFIQLLQGQPKGKTKWPNLVKVRDRDGEICRPASVEILE